MVNRFVEIYEKGGKYQSTSFSVKITSYNVLPMFMHLPNTTKNYLQKKNISSPSAIRTNIKL